MSSGEMMKVFTIVVFILFVIRCEGDASPPNIIFILADDLGWDDVGFHGSDIKTPNIDRLAKEGVILNNYYVQPLCTPTRAAILTGRYPIHTGLQHDTIMGSQPYGLPLSEKTMAQYFKFLGYKTHCIGKWHLGFFKEEYLPTNRGFDSHFGFYLGAEDHFDHYTDDAGIMGYFGYDLHRNGKAVWNKSEIYGTDMYTTEAESIILSHDKAEPLFLYLAEQVVHAGSTNDPIQAPQKYIDRFPYIKNFARRTFAGMAAALDDSVGRVYKALQDAGMADNTILVFTTDNGGPTNGYNSNAACNWPLRGCKETMWEGGVRGVSFIHSPLLEKTGYINNDLMHAVDWLPTLLSKATTMATGEKLDRNMESLDGVNQWDVISQQKQTTRKEVLINIDPISKLESVIVGDFKLVKGQIRSGQYDGWYPPPSSDDENDLYKKHNQAENRADLHAELDEYQKPKGTEYKHMTDVDLDNLIVWMNEEYEKFTGNSKSMKYSPKQLIFDSEKTLKSDPGDLYLDEKTSQKGENNGTIVVDCGVKPSNASTNCKAEKEACLFHLSTDPCEFNNLAPSLSGIVLKLQGRLDYYRSGMVPPANKPADPRGNPQLNGGVWQPWL